MNGLRYFDGKVFDGYIRGAEVFVDTNDNLTLDANEASVSTDNAGSFTKLLFGNGTLVSKGGFDLDTGADLSDLTLVHKLEGYEASKLASPFTTLIAYMTNASNINAALGIDASINLLTTDPIPNLGEGIYDQMYEKGNQLTVLSYTLQNQAAADSSQLYFEAIADQLEESYAANQAAVDIEDPTFISNVIDKAETASATTLSPDVKANLNAMLSTTIPLLKVYADSNTTASVQRFTFSTLQNDVQDSAVIGSSTSSTIAQYNNNVFEYVATDQGIDEAVINPDYNFAPSITSSATFSAAENQTAIGSVTATDADGDSLTYSISGSEINISSSGVLTFASAPDYETKNSYTATVTVSDGTDSVTQSITVTVTDVDETVPNEAPTISSSATFSAAENQTAIGSVTATDADGDSLTYSISGSEINISSSGVLTFATAPDYETKNSYTATVTVSDGTDSASQSITVTVVNKNDAPFFALNLPNSFTAMENQKTIDESGGYITIYDVDGDDLNVSISGSEIILYDPNTSTTSSGSARYMAVLNFVTAPDFETKDLYSATITVSDGTVSISRDITINIRIDNSIGFTWTLVTADGIDTGVSGNGFSVPENQTAIGSFNGQFIDLNGEPSKVYTNVYWSTDNINYLCGQPQIAYEENIQISNEGVLSFINPPDYETKNNYYTNAYYSEQPISSEACASSFSFEVAITDVVEAAPNAAPTIGSSATFSAAENQTAIGSVTATDADGDSLTYSVSSSEINISSSGVLSFATAPDYETKTSYTATVTVSDGTVSTTQDITVNVTDVNDNVAPTIGSSATFSAAENQTAIGSITATDADSDSLTYSISGSEINISSSGVLSFASAPDYETKNSYTATVTVSDGTASPTQDITVNITDVNDNSPVFTSSATFNSLDDTKLIYKLDNSYSEAVKTTDLDINKVLSKAGDKIILEVSLNEPIICSTNVTNSFYKNSDDTDSTLNKCSVILRLLPRSYDGTSITVETETDLIVAADRNDDYDASHFDLIDTFYGTGGSDNVVDYLKWDADDWNIPKRITISINEDIEQLSSTYLSTEAISETELYGGFDPEDIFPGQSFDDSLRMSFKYVSPVSYSISNSDISIDPNNGELKFVNSVDIDNQSSVTATVTANDGVNSSTQDITIDISTE